MDVSEAAITCRLIAPIVATDAILVNDAFVARRSAGTVNSWNNL